MDRLTTRHRLFFSCIRPIAVTLLWHVFDTDRPTFSTRVRIGKCRTLLRALVCNDDRSAAVSCTKRHE